MTITNSNTFKLNITAATVGPWTPPYPVPQFDGHVVPIAGYASAGSKYETNVWNNVCPSNATSGNGMLLGNDTASMFHNSFSVAGAVITAGGGGHKGTSNVGAAVFDFTDARWKRIWTHSGNPGVDNITNEGPPPSQGGPPYIDRRTGTRVHGVDTAIAGGGDDLITLPLLVSGHGDFACWLHEHWNANQGSPYVVTAADPRDQTWECTMGEPYKWGPVLIEDPVTGITIEGLHGWKFPGEWAADWGGVYGDIDFDSHYIAPGPRFPNVIPKGTLEPTQSGLPLPAHIWDHFFEMPPSQGGGPKGSIVTGRSIYGGVQGVTSMYWSHRFDLHTGIWHKYSNNTSWDKTIGKPQDPPGGGPVPCAGSTASAYDPVMDRVFMLDAAARTSSSTARMNYLNCADRTWRNMTLGSGTTLTSAGQTQNITVDPVRRLLLLHAEIAPYYRAFNLATLGPEPIPTGGTGGWAQLPVTAVSPFVLAGGNNLPWRYFPPNGKFYKFRTKTSPKSSPTLAPISTLQRLTPPPVIPNPPAGYYYTQPWTYDEITLKNDAGADTTVPSGEWGPVWSAVGHKWLFYVPALQCLAWFPVNPNATSPVYLIKPY